MRDFRFSEENKKVISKNHAKTLIKGEPTSLLFPHQMYDLVQVSTEWLLDEVFKQLNSEKEESEGYEF